MNTVIILTLALVLSLLQRNNILVSISIIGWVTYALQPFVVGMSTVTTGIAIAVLFVTALNQFPNGGGRGR